MRYVSSPRPVAPPTTGPAVGLRPPRIAAIRIPVIPPGYQQIPGYETHRQRQEARALMGSIAERRGRPTPAPILIRGDAPSLLSHRRRWCRFYKFCSPELTTGYELVKCNILQDSFRKDQTVLVHWDMQRQAYVDIDASQQTGFGVVIYHVKRSYQHKDLSKSPPSNVVEPIMFLSRLLSPAEKNYWATELEVSCITWTLRKVRHLVEGAKEPVVFYTDHLGCWR
ncbi:hypothetical protein N7524_010396 [Penicillium chrysogenum]|nr:hypothetical protein N7524_010396 [Penicillium chrysogenum]